MKTTQRTGFGLILRREWRWFWRRKVLWALATYIPLGMFAFLAVSFWHGVATSLPIAVLDNDNTQLSRTISTRIDASPTVEIVTKVYDLNEAKRNIRGGTVYGVIVIPEHFSRDIMMGRQPEMTLFYNTQMLSAGNQVAKAFQEVLPALALEAQGLARLSKGMTTKQAAAAVNPIPIQSHALFNPAFDYSHFILAGIIVAVLELTIALAAALTIILDMAIDPKLRVVRRMGNGVFQVILAKQLIIFVFSCLVYGICDAIMFSVYDLPLEGSGGLLLASTLLFIIAAQLFGVFWAVLLKSDSALAPTGMILAPAFGYLGVSFPREAMSGFSLGFSYVIPGKAHIPVRFDQTLRGAPVEFSMPAFREQLIYIAIITLIIAILLALHLRRSKDSEEEAETTAPAGQPGEA
ncbi:ABC transporter permease [Palleronia caenipelagi]|uniref:ABC transporter permease n=1 Tax=Palleronia caenipelagi TaxID=2489174 RepID=A0A547QA75_9RHOB|nr:ABC transporter permease [Palleronia caenipelagi]TRD23295.1 ABC transporter permease [Palleronia caenipelagi]